MYFKSIIFLIKMYFSKLLSYASQKYIKLVKCPFPSHFIFEINVGKRRIRHPTTLKLNDEFQIGYKSIEDDVIQILSRSISDPPHSDIDFKNKMAWVLTALNLVRGRHFCLGTKTTGTRSFRVRGRSAEACLD